MTGKNIKVAVAGCGHWGKNIVRNYHELGALAAICEENPQTANAISEKYKVPVKSWHDVLGDKDIPAVAIAAPAVFHYELAKAALEAGKDVFVEKPLALKINHAEELCELAAKNNRILMVGHLLQYHPAFLKVKELVAEGRLGKLNYIYSNRLNFGKLRTEEDVLWSFAPHDISMVLSMAGQEPETVSAEGSARLQNNLPDKVITHLSFANGPDAHIFSSWLNPFKEQKLVVIGEEGMIVFDDRLDWSEKLTLYPHKISWTDKGPDAENAEGQTLPLPVSEPLKNECQHFLNCVRDRSTPRTDGQEGLRVLKVLTEASAALNSTSKVKKMNSPQPDVKIHESAYVDQPCEIGEGTKIWHFSHVLPHTKIGKNVTIGQNCVLGPHISVGDNCKIQNNVSVYKGVTLEDGVFCGPSCVFTNVNNPRAEIERKDEFRQTLVKRGTSIGANATIVCGYTLGEYCFIAAGAVVTGDVPDFALMAGVPAKRIGWMSHAGAKLGSDLVCPIEGRQYEENNGILKEVVKQKEKAHG